ncbi:Nuclear-interacting partner of ALK [Erysiphe necator]|nr:Nuclear-interacting partner of ALK [Erysiphe necator]
MNTTKRKFNALLNSIGSRPSSIGHDGMLQNESISSRKDIIAKRRRVTDTFSNLDQKENVHLNSNSSLGHKNSLDSEKAPMGSAEPTMPMYAPWDREQFLKRLKTFSSISHWTPKPAPVNEVEWAKRGWICQKFERVRCCSCDVEIVVKLNRKEIDGKEEPVYMAHVIEKALVEKYVQLIVTSHKKNCLWRKRGCDDSIFRLNLNQPSSTIKNLKTRYDELKLCSENLPYIYDLRTPEEFDLEVTLRYLLPDFFADENLDTNVALTNTEKVAFTLAVFGWQGYQHERLGTQPNSVSCHVCFRVLGLWIFKSKETSETGEKIRGATMNCLDVVGQHREYCPWRNAISQNGSLSTKLSLSELIPGWKVVLRVLKSEFSMLNQSSDAYKSLRHDILEKGEREKKDNEIRSRLKRVRSLFIHNSTRKGTKNDTNMSANLPND